MSLDQSGGPAELVQMALISRRYFIEGVSKIDIAEQTGLSRFKVARLLDKARALGLVKIEISYPGTIDVDASSRLQDALGLRHALVLDAVEDHAAGLRADLGAAAAELLTEIVTADDVLGLAWARSVSAMSAAMTRLAPCTVVQMTGALPGPEVDASATELVREAARTGGGPAYFFYAPMIVGSAAMAQALRQQPEVARAMAKLPSVTKAVVGVGSWDPPFSTLYDALEPAERESLHELGVRAEVSGILIDTDGEPVPTPLNERMIGVGAADLLRVPEVIAMVYDTTKSRAVLAAVRGGLVNSLITHRSLAEAMLRDVALHPMDHRPERLS
jgi:DNA-binding transcriptional regulator LsrR (DeoR family)